MPASAATTNLTANETALVVALLKHSTQQNLDWDGIVQEIGTTNKHAAMERVRKLKQKLGIISPRTPAASRTTPASTPKLAGGSHKGKRKSKSMDDITNDDDVEMDTPCKKPKLEDHDYDVEALDAMIKAEDAMEA